MRRHLYELESLDSISMGQDMRKGVLVRGNRDVEAETGS